MMSRISLYSLIVPVFLLILSSCSPSYDTCDICGYKSLDAEKCVLCLNPKWDESMSESNEDYIKSKQITWFIPEGGKVDFYAPKEAEDLTDGSMYQKDMNWKPLVTEEEIPKPVEMSVEDILGDDTSTPLDYLESSDSTQLDSLN